MDLIEQVHSLYHTALGRLADPEGLANAIHRMRSGGSLGSLANDLVASTEFQNRHGGKDEFDIKFIMTLFRDGPGRQPDAKTLSSWLRKRKRKGIRTKLLIAVAGSTEALARVRSRISEQGTDYARWIAAYDTISSVDRVAIRTHIAHLPFRPRISVILSGDEPTESALQESLPSLVGQIYTNWELCIGANTLLESKLGTVLAKLNLGRPSVFDEEPPLKEENRVNFIRIARLNDSASTAARANAALGIATGQFVAFLRPGDLLPEHAFYEVAIKLSEDPDAEILFTDCDQMDNSHTRSGPWFRPGWDPDLLLAHDYLTDLVIYRRELLEAIGCYRAGFEGAELHDLALRATRSAQAERIVHIPAILYHRKGPRDERRPLGAFAASNRAVHEHLAAQDVNGVLLQPVSLVPEARRVVWPISPAEPLVSVIIPTRDRADLLARCVDGVLHRTNYRNLELLIVDNESIEPPTHALFARVEQEEHQTRILHHPGQFNYSALNNAAAREARGEILLLLNNDINVIERDWLREMVSHAIRPDVGIVGAKLLYENTQVQHAGIVLGPKNAVTHRHRFAERSDPGYFGDLALTQTLSAVTGACIAIRRALFCELGGLDETNLQVAFNDIDLCLRVKQLGYRVIWTPFSELFHLELASRGLDRADPVKYERSLRELQHLRATWGDLLDSGDPFHNPNILFGWDFCQLPSAPRRHKSWWDYFTEECLDP